MPTYAGTQSVSGFGSTLSINTGTLTTPVWTPIGEVTDISISGRKNTTANATNLLSTFAEFTATVPEPGSFAISGNFIATDTGQAAVETAFEGALRKEFKLQLPISGTQTTTGNSYIFTAIIEENNFVDAISPQKLLTFKMTFKLSGPLAVTTGS